MSTTGTRTALYLRVSSKEQETNSSHGFQEQTCRVYAAEHGLTILEQHVYRETYSGAYLGRAELERLQGAIDRHELDVVLVYHSDRIGRDPDDRTYLMVAARRHGVRWLSATDDISDSSPQGQLLAYVAGFAARIERESITRRTRAGLKARVEGGRRLVGGKAPYGYEWVYVAGTNGKPVKDHLAVIEAEAAVVRLIYARLQQGESTRAIAQHLNATGIPTPNPGRAKPGRVPRWQASTIYCLLKNPVYMGRSVAFRVEQTVVDQHTGRIAHAERPASEWVEVGDQVEPLVTPEQWQLGQERLRKNKEQASRSSRNYEDALLRGGFAVCGYCGAALQVQRPKGRALYKCGHPYPVDGCRTKPGAAWGAAIDAATLDAAVWQALEGVLANPAMLLAKLQAAAQQDTAAVQVQSLEAQLVACGKQVEKLAAGIALAASEAAMKVLVTKLEKATAEQASLQAARADALQRSQLHQASLHQAEQLLDWCQQERDLHGSLTYADKRAALERAGVQVQLYRDRPMFGRWDLVLRPTGISLPDMASVLEDTSKHAAGSGWVSAYVGATVNTTVSSTRPPVLRCRARGPHHAAAPRGAWR